MKRFLFRRIVTFILFAALLSQPLAVLATDSSETKKGKETTTEGTSEVKKEKRDMSVSHVYKKGKYYYYYDAKKKKYRKKKGFVKWKGDYYYVRKGGKILTNAGVIKGNKTYFAGKDGALDKVTLELPEDAKRSKVVKKAQKQVGIRTGVKYWKWYFGSRFIDTDRTPWCGTFVAWIYKKTGLFSKIRKARRYGNLGYVPSYYAFAKRNKKWIKRSQAAPGDIVIFGKRRGTHIGIVEGVYKGYVYTIEGNSGPTARVGCKKPGACTRQVYKMDAKRIKGIVRVL